MRIAGKLARLLARAAWQQQGLQPTPSTAGMKTIPLRPAPDTPPARPPSGGPRPQDPQPPWRPGWLLAAPHRLGFFAASVLMVAAALWWAVVVLARLGALPQPAQAVPASLVHALVMVLGFLPLFFVGFLFTAGPKWLRQPEQSARALLPPVAALGLGWLAVLVGGMVARPLAALGAAAAACGWAVVTGRFIALVRTSPAEDRLHARLVAWACCVGVLAMGWGAVALMRGEPAGLRAAATLGLWGCVVPVYLVVAHRMIPFFTANVVPMIEAWRPVWLLAALMAASGAQAVLWWADEAGMAGTAVAVARLLVSGACGLSLLVISWRWGLVQSLRIRLLAMLHLGFFWLGVALALDAVSAALRLASHGQATLGLAPLHALTMGFLGSTLVAMATRVSAGHSGRPLAADDRVWRLFFLLQAAVVLRLLAAIWPAPWGAVGTAGLLAAAALGWLVVVAAWAARHIGWYGRPRVDGKPG